MAITALQVISRSMRLLQVLPPDANPTAQESADGLYALNSMLDAWGIERLMVYQIQQANYSWAAGASSKTIGSGGDFNASRPAKIEKDGNFFRSSGGIDYQLEVYPRQDYDRIVYKSSTGSFPEYLFYDGGHPLMTLYVYPVPSETLTLYLNTWSTLQQFAALSTQVALPPGYRAAVEYNLAIWMAPEFGAAAKRAANDIKDEARLLKANIKAVNFPDLIAQTDLVGHRSNILTGG